ncbi:MAG: hypothetical protein GY793_00370 [Proteobacteria bacterium]|nr:hypothetical protein [Pseudomonadota bacterium]
MISQRIFVVFVAVMAVVVVSSIFMGLGDYVQFDLMGKLTEMVMSR